MGGVRARRVRSLAVYERHGVRRRQADGCGPADVGFGPVRIITDQTSPAFPGERTVVTIGAYDGVHRGHRGVIEQVRRLAADRGCRSAVVTFDKHPATVVRPASAPLLLTGPEEKIELLAATGVDAVVVVPFDEAQAAESPESFVQRVLVDCLATTAIVVGEDFHFGRHRDGNVDLLRKIGLEADFDVEPLELLERGDGVDEPVSSTAIRRALAGGDITLANEMLGYPFEVRGSVRQGDQRGGCSASRPPTSRCRAGSVCPADGVYAGWYERPNGDVHECAINVGRRPTFYEDAETSLLEAHLLDFDDDLYDEPARVRFAHFLRSERKFDGIDALDRATPRRRRERTDAADRLRRLTSTRTGRRSASGGPDDGARVVVHAGGEVDHVVGCDGRRRHRTDRPRSRRRVRPAAPRRRAPPGPCPRACRRGSAPPRSPSGTPHPPATGSSGCRSP